MATPENIQKVRFELADTDPVFPFLSDVEINYFLDKNNSNVRRASLDCAKTILLKLSMQNDEIAGILSFKGSKAAENYRNALKLYLNDPNLNPALTLAEPYAGGISKSDMQSNIDNPDNNAVITPGMEATYGVETPLDEFKA